MSTVFEKENLFSLELNGTKLLHVELGWNAKKGSLKDRIEGALEAAIIGESDKSFDMNLFAILKYSDGTKPELVFHKGAAGRGADESGAVVLGKDNRTGFGHGGDETLEIHLEEVPGNVNMILLSANIGGAELNGQKLADIQGVIAQIQDAADSKVLLRDEDGFAAECAGEYCCYTFAALCRKEQGWILRGVSRYSDEACEQCTLEAMG